MKVSCAICSYHIVKQTDKIAHFPNFCHLNVTKFFWITKAEATPQLNNPGVLSQHSQWRISRKKIPQLPGQPLCLKVSKYHHSKAPTHRLTLEKSQTAPFVDKLTNWTPLRGVHAFEVWIEVWAVPYLKFYLKNCSRISAYQSSVTHLDVEMITGCGREHLLGHASRQSFLSFYIYSLRGNNYWQLLPVLCELSVQIKTGGKENKLLKLHLRLQFSILKNI